jgi:hypothetical protein
MDTVLKVLAMGCFIAFLAVLPIWVPRPDLAIVVGIAAAMGIYDFFIRPLRLRR